jgi:hypothetical protein
MTPWDVPLPPAFLPDPSGNGQSPQLRDLLTYIVRQEVHAFEQRRSERRLLRVLSPQEIGAAASQGKIAMGGAERESQHPVDEEAAVEVALQGFLDGLYLVFIDGQQQRDLAALVQLAPTSTLLFLRLVALVGG